jgi:exo-beta-1,3-glucanase (GH17 family)
MTSRLLSVLAAVLFAVAGCYVYWSQTNTPVDAGPDVPGGKLRSVSFAPFRGMQSPLTKTYPTPAQIEEDMARLAGRVSSIRTYTSREGMEILPELGRKYGIKITMGAWLGGETGPKGEEGKAINRAEVDSLVTLANAYPDVIERVIVGNEVLLRGDLKPDQLIGYIKEVKSRIKQPVSYADVWAFQLKHPQVGRELDYVTVHLLPFWEDEPTAIDGVGANIVHYFKKIQEAFPGKPVLIGEAGWPTMGRSRGPAAPGVVNSAKFVRTLIQVADQNGFDYNVVEAFDQPWKASLEGTVGAKWGLWSADRDQVFPLAGPVVEHPDWPLRFGLSVLVMLLLVAPFAQRLGGAWAFGVVALAQVMAAGLVHYAFVAHASGISFWAKFNFGIIPMMLAAGFAVALAAFAAVVVERATHAFDGRAGDRLAAWAPRLFRFFSLAAAVLTAMIVYDGRYRDIPVLPFLVPSAAVVGLTLLRLASGRDLLSAAAAWETFGARPCHITRALSWALPALAALNLGAEGWAIIGDDFTAMHPGLGEQVPLVLHAMVSNSSVLLWSGMLLALAVPHLADMVLARRTGLVVGGRKTA